MRREVALAGSRIEGRDASQILDALADRRGPERLLDLMLRAGPYGDGFGADPDGLTLERLEAAPHGIDLGPLEPRIPEVLRTPSGKIELAPEPIAGDVARMHEELAHLGTNGNGNGMVLVGRRQLRSNNSWMHNLPPLAKGKLALHRPRPPRRRAAPRPRRRRARRGELVAPARSSCRSRSPTR